MIIWTTVGVCEITESLGEPEWFTIRSREPKAIDSIVHALQLTDTEEDDDGGFAYRAVHEEHSSYIVLSKGTAALWIQHELLNYVDYTSFGKALLERGGVAQAVAFEKLTMNLETL